MINKGLSKPLPRILVLMATYNGSQWVREQLDSILTQEDIEVSVMLADDFSLDGTPAIIQRFYGGDSRVKMFKSTEQSGSAGSNFRRLYIGAKLDEFDFVALADQDDIWMPRKLVTAVDALHEHVAQGYSAAVEAFWSNGRHSILKQSSSQRSLDFIFEGAGQGCTFVVTVGLFRRVQSLCRQFPDSAASLHYHDWLIYLLCRAWNYKWYFDSVPSMRYRQHAGNEIGARGGFGAVTRRLRLIRSGWYSKQVEAAINLFILAGGNDQLPYEINVLMKRPRSFLRNCELMVLFLKHGRRRLIDRSILSGAALVGWL